VLGALISRDDDGYFGRSRQRFCAACGPQKVGEGKGGVPL
jgi:hypothetical protein